MLNLIECILQSIGYIENHLNEPITVSDMADAAGYSVFHFIRSFNQVVWHTPYDYLIRRRLTRAVNDLVSSNRRIIDIAQDYCIGSQESFTRLFRKMFNQTPGQCRAAGGVDWWKTFQEKTAEDLCFSSQLDPTNIILTEMATIRLKGLMSRVEEGLNSRDDLRAALAADMSKIIPTSANCQPYEIWSGIYPGQTESYCFFGYPISEVDNNTGILAEQTINGGRVIEVGVNKGEEVCATRFSLSSWIPSRELKPALPLCLIIRKGSFSNINSKESLLIRVERNEE